jgi:predicted DCC family thiol-disulfide oxidoreductase YuxK
VTPVLLYDGTCGFCAESVQLVLRYDRRRTLRFASLQGAFGTEVRARHPELAGADTVVWVEPGSNERSERVLLRSEAALRVAAYLGGWFHLARVAAVLPRPCATPRPSCPTSPSAHGRDLAGAAPDDGAIPGSVP